MQVEGQIYIGAVNWTLAVLCVAAVAGFRDSVRLANAYGVAVSMDMNFTNILMMASPNFFKLFFKLFS